ncbi:MAG: transporter [Myxococcaceae bacterium]|jgi:DHA1 family multidrug resistance protein-like MFS transporter|nr:transporter [Myxococcaceae bacterium]
MRGSTRLVVLFTIAGFFEAVLWGHVNAFVPLHLPALGVRAADVAAWTGLATMIGTAVGLPTLPFWGALADRYARKPVIVRSFVAYVVGCSLAALAGNMALFVVGRTVMSLSMGNSGLMMATLNERVPSRRAALAFAIFNSAPPLGAFIGPILVGPLVDAHGVRVVLALDAAVMIAITAALSFGYRDDYTTTERRSVTALAIESLRVVTGSARLRRLFPTLFFLFGGWMLANLYVALVVAARFPSAHLATRIGWVLACGGGGAVLLAPALGALADRLGTWRVLLGAAAAEVLCWGLPAMAPGLASFAVAWGLVNGVAAAVFALGFAALAESAPAGARGRVMAFAYLPTTGGYAIASLVGALVPGAIVAVVFPAAAALTALGVAGIVWSRRAAPA